MEPHWDDFKIFFRRAHQEIRDTTDIGLEEAQRQEHQANLVNEIVESIQTAMQPTDAAEAPTDPYTQHCLPATTPTDVANSATSMPQIMQQIQAMQQAHMEQMTTLIATLQGNQRGNPKAPKRKRTRTKYCWTHGACAHAS